MKDILTDEDNSEGHELPRGADQVISRHPPSE
jgi:hypothetical protein